MKHATDQLKVTFAVKVGDVTTFDADVLALKFAQALYGADEAVARALGKDEYEMRALLPALGSYKLFPALGKISAKSALFLGVPPLSGFRYEEIRWFAAKVLKALANDAPFTRHLAMTIHGAGYDLDETEAFQSQLAGFLDALESNHYPPALERITIVELNRMRAQRLRTVLDNAIPGHVVILPKLSPTHSYSIERSPLVSNVGRESADKPHIFVVMSPTEETDNVFHYGIMGPAREAGYLCERANLTIPKTKDTQVNGAAAEKSEAELAYMTKLRKLLVGYFDKEELRTLCFDLGVNYDKLRGEGEEGKARELVLYLSRHTRFLELVESVKARRPKAPWSDILQNAPPEQLHLERIKLQIDTASLVIAEITATNPHVFLLVGYAWGKGLPMILLSRGAEKPPIDVRGQRCLVYSPNRILDLEEALTKELSEIKDDILM